MAMMEKNIKKEFIEFLKQNNVLKEYKENLIKYKEKLHPENIIQIIIDPFNTIRDPFHTGIKSINTHYNIIDYSFKWSNTPQGYGFWSKLNSQWNEKLYKQCQNKNK